MSVNDNFAVENRNFVAELAGYSLNLLWNPYSRNSHSSVLTNLVGDVNSCWQVFGGVRDRLPNVAEFDCDGIGCDGVRQNPIAAFL